MTRPPLGLPLLVLALVPGARVAAAPQTPPPSTQTPFAAPAQRPAPATPAPATPPAAPASTPPAATPLAATPPAQGAAPATPPTEVYSYNPEGRRDPFVSLLFRGSELSVGRENRPEGREGLTIGEVTIRGIVKNRNAYVAMLSGPDNKSYIIHPGDKMLDGVVRAITADAVVFAQDVNDPLSLVKQREVRKMLRLPEEGK